MEVSVNFDASSAICDINYVGANIDSEAAFEEWTSKLWEGFKRAFAANGDRKFALIVNIDGLTIGKDYRERYSKDVAIPAAKQYASVIARYGESTQTGRVVAVEAMRRVVHIDDPIVRMREYAANIFVSRGEAVSFVELVAEQGAKSAS